MVRPAWLLQQIVPPLGLTYFFVAWRTCAFDLGPGYIASMTGYRLAGYAYSLFATVSISLMSFLYLRLYFLPRSQALPPFNPPEAIQANEVIYECLSPSEASAVRLAQKSNSQTSSDETTEDTPVLHSDNRPLVNRCYRDQCQGRWKPPRARHCSLCKTCRGGFDHHCAIFANCLTAPYIPTFLSLLLCTPPIVLTLASPLLLPLVRRTRMAWATAGMSEDIRRRWWDWKSTWMIAGGPMGRCAGGLILGWKELDRQDKGGRHGEVRLQIGVLVFLGWLFSAICLALAFATIQVIREGHLTVDRERARTHSRSRYSILKLHQSGQPIPPALIAQMERYADRRWCFVPIPDHPDGGVIIPTLPDERAYDLGPERNWEVIMGRGWDWIWPWNALRRGMRMEMVCQWPLAEEVEERLGGEAARLADLG